MKPNKKLKINEDAQSLVEFALVLPILLLLVLGMIEFGWILNGKITLNSAAREGARVAAVLNVSEAVRDTRVYNTIKDSIDVSGLTVNEDDVDVTPVNIDSENIHNVVVKVTGELEPIIGLFVPDTVEMSTVATMRRE
jgi:Flp pilus assembly protein TadG